MTTPPDPPAAQFGQEVRKYRRCHGLSQEALAAKLQITQGHLSKIELGARNPHREIAGKLDTVFTLDGHFLTRYLSLFESRRGVAEWFLKYLDLEPKASIIRSYDLAIIPGFFQTADYARVIFQGGMVKPSEVEARVNSRLARRTILDSDDPPSVFAVLDASSLHREIGSREIMIDQLAFLLDMMEHSTVSIQVVPLTGVRTTVGVSSGFIIIEVDETRYVSIEAAGLSSITADPRTVDRTMMFFDHLRSESLPTTQSRKVIEEQWKTLR
ncbi:helix-turn-helix transcriptional regulator [Sphaerisporangium rubeum]|uniref:Transcriptional regulator with XRE-family HTH domain n=1 Tax=Sphaerisporangium rubeum TaxID=321317 RepID=A0A7X0M4D9_9ACTN|nr:helix-turn-helix transcriptional regulator [Sphaerisporangium rubeum]MBB6471558.1 transcriptional regulator with XRE-family HTH domain [Sphaerisporangium rubeum]